jgi:hypothetical protein
MITTQQAFSMDDILLYNAPKSRKAFRGVEENAIIDVLMRAMFEFKYDRQERIFYIGAEDALMLHTKDGATINFTNWIHALKTHSPHLFKRPYLSVITDYI